MPTIEEMKRKYLGESATASTHLEDADPRTHVFAWGEGGIRKIMGVLDDGTIAWAQG